MRTLIALILLAQGLWAQEISVSPMAVGSTAVADESYALVDSQADSTAIDGNTPWTFSYTTTANTSGLLLLWLRGDVDSIYSVTYNGNAATKSWTTGDGKTMLFSVKAPAAGAHNWVVNYGTTELYGRHFNACTIEFSGVNQTTPLGTVALTTGNSAGTVPLAVSGNVSSATGEVVTGIIHFGSGGSIGGWTDEDILTFTDIHAGATAKLLCIQKAGATTTTLTAHVDEVFIGWFIVGVSVKPL